MSLCRKCGHSDDTAQYFCPQCGEFLGWADESPRPTSPAPPPPPALPAAGQAVPSSRAAALLADPVIRQAQQEAEAAQEEARRVRAEADERARAETETAMRRATDEAREARNAASARAQGVVDEATRTAHGSRAEVAAMVAQIREEAESRAQVEVTDAELRAARKARRAREEAHARARAEAAEAEHKAAAAGQRAAALLARVPEKPTEPAPPVAPARPGASTPPIVSTPPIEASAPVVSVLPAAAQPRRQPRVTEPESPPPVQPGDLICGRCGTASESARRFCRKCGESLVAVPTAPVPGRFWRLRGWLRRVSAPIRGERGEGAAPVPAAGANSGPGVSLSNVWRGALAVLAVVGLAAAVGPYRKQARADITRVRRHVLPKPAYIDAEVGSGGPQEACTACLTDKLLGPKAFLSTQIDTNPPSPGGAPAFSIALGEDGNLTKPVNVFKVGIVAGVLGEQPAKHPGVHHLLLVAHGEGGAQLKAKMLTLHDDTSFQSFLFTVPRVLHVDFYVLDTYSSSGREGPYAIDEVQFFALT